MGETTGIDWLDRARRLTERSGSRPGPGQEKAHADALLAQMRADGLLALPVAPAFGGPGLGLEEIARITAAIARQSGSAGLIHAMHMSQAFSVVRHGVGPAFDAFQRRMVTEQILIASGTSEKGPGGDILHSVCTIAETPEGGLSLVKESPNISYLDHAGAILVTANRQGAKGKPRQVLILVETAAATLTPGRESSFLGMRGILNRPWTIEARFAEAALFPGTFGPIARDTMTPVIHILWAALWSGIAAAALDRAKAFVAKELPADGEVAPVTQHALTRLINRHYMMNALIRDAIRDDAAPARAEDAMGFGRAARINRLKLCASELLEEICQGALHIVGIRGYATGGPYSLTEPLADALSASIMVSNTRLAMNTAKIEGYVAEDL